MTTEQRKTRLIEIASKTLILSYYFVKIANSESDLLDNYDSFGVFTDYHLFHLLERMDTSSSISIAKGSAKSPQEAWREFGLESLSLVINELVNS